MKKNYALLCAAALSLTAFSAQAAVPAWFVAKHPEWKTMHAGKKAAHKAKTQKKESK